MASRRLRSLGVVPLAIAGAVALGVSPTSTRALVAGAKTVLAEARLLDTESWIIGPSGMPIPSSSYIENVSERYIEPTSPFFDGQPRFPVNATNPLFTPEGLYPTTVGEPVKSLEYDPSVAQGISILNSTITNQIADGNNLVVLGFSQSATISSLKMRDLLALPEDEQPSHDQLSFVLLGDLNNPDGGVLELFGDPSLPPLTIPSLGITFSGATPADTPWDTAIYTLEYDGFADFPRYPIDLLSDINAYLGTAFVHTTYPNLTDAQMASAFKLPVSDDYSGHTQYFMIPTENLPLVAPLRDFVPVVGKPLADLLQPDLRVLVNLGYGDIDHGWYQGPANVPTPFGLFGNIDLGDLFHALEDGAQKGTQDFIGDLGALSMQSVLEEVIDGGDVGGDSLPSFTDIVNAFTSAVATVYATLLPTADMVNALITTLPAYDASLFVQELTSGNLFDAIGLPIAADFGLVTMGAGFELEPIVGAVTSILGIGSPLNLLPP